MSATHPVYIGYATLEDLLAALSGQDPRLPLAGRPIQSLGITEEEPGPQGLRYVRYLQIVSFVAFDTVHYVRVPFGVAEFIADTDFGHRNAAVRARAEQGGQIIDDWLRSKDLTVQRAIVATPRDLKWLDGWAGCLDWDTDAKRFRTPEEIQA